MTTLDSLLNDAFSFVLSEFGFDIEQSQLKPYSPENWLEFCQINGFDESSSGIYVPTSHSAYVRTDSPFLASNIFHELYGHGLFVEHSQIGKRLEEQLSGIAKRDIHNYEGFAVWLEALLCKETDNSQIWAAKQKGLREEYAQLFELFEDAEEQLSRFGLIAQMGFPKHYDENTVVDTLRKVYGSAFNNIQFVVLYGSQKPESDIDLCVVSTNNSQQYFNGWLDIAELNIEDFKERMHHLDIALTDAMFSGRVIFGDENEFRRYKQAIVNKPITREMIEYNHKKSELQKEYLAKYQDDERMRKLCLSYINSYSQNAEQLRSGHKLLTLTNL